MKPNELRFRICGDSGLMVELGDAIDEEVRLAVYRLLLTIQEHPLDTIKEIIPAFRSILLNYNPLFISLNDVKTYVQEMMQLSEKRTLPAPRSVKIPVVYGGEFGPDLEFVAKHNHLDIQEVIRLHTARKYVLYMFGFSPGFPVVGGLDEKLYTPRLETPRTMVPAGSVGIGNNQTGIYPVVTPGGWRIIGRTPLRLCRPEVNPPVLFQLGDTIEFYPISETEYLQYLNNEENQHP